MQIAVIASLKRGLEQFVYRELLVFQSQGCRLRLFPTKLNPGLYDPQPGWEICRWSYAAVAWGQIYALVRAPLRYLRLLKEALASRALVDFALAWHFSRFLDGVDVIYSTFGDHKLYIGYFCKRITGKPLAVTIHAYELYRNPNPLLFRRSLAHCDRIITVTEYNRELLRSRFGIDPEKVTVVRIGIDLEDYRPQKKFVILIAAFFAERKGHEVLFRAVKRLGQPDIEVWVVGDQGAERGIDVRALARRVGIESQVAFFGSLSGNALKAAFRSCDVFCLPCRTDSHGIAEGFPTVLAEAMAFGKPVITSRHVEIPRVVREILVEENDVEGLAQAIRTAYEKPGLRQQLGKHNRQIAEQLFSSRNAVQTVEILSSLAGRRPSASPIVQELAAFSTAASRQRRARLKGPKGNSHVWH